MLYAYLGAVYFVGTLGVMIAGYLGFRAFHHHKKEARAALVRLLVVGVVTLSIYLQLATPALLQFREAWLDRGRSNPLGMEWIFAVITEYSTGVLLVPAWREAAEASGGDMSLAKYVTASLFKTDPWYVVLVFLLIPVCTIGGLIRLWRMGFEVKLLVAAAIMAPMPMFLHPPVWNSQRVVVLVSDFCPACCDYVGRCGTGCIGQGGNQSDQNYSTGGASCDRSGSCRVVFLGFILTRHNRVKRGETHRAAETAVHMFRINAATITGSYIKTAIPFGYTRRIQCPKSLAPWLRIRLS